MRPSGMHTTPLVRTCFPSCRARHRHRGTELSRPARWERSNVAEGIDHDRRRFLGRAAMTIAATHLGTFGTANAGDGVSRELAAIGTAPEWLNSARLTPSGLAGKVVVVDFCTY